MWNVKRERLTIIGATIIDALRRSKEGTGTNQQEGTAYVTTINSRT
jgi:hypothetical protein